MNGLVVLRSIDSIDSLFMDCSRLIGGASRAGAACLLRGADRDGAARFSKYAGKFR